MKPVNNYSVQYAMLLLLAKNWLAKYTRPIQRFIRSLKLDYIVFSSAAVMVVLLFASYTSWYFQRHNEQQLQREIMQRTMSIERTFSGTLNAIEHTTQFMGEVLVRMGVSHPHLVSLLKRKDNIDIEFNNSYAWLDFSFRTTDGAILNPHPMHSHDIAMYPIESARQFPGQLQIGGIIQKSDIQGYAMLPIAMGIADKKGGYLGELIAGIPLAMLEKYINNMAYNGDNQFHYTILAPAGNIMASSQGYNYHQHAKQPDNLTEKLAQAENASGAIDAKIMQKAQRYSYYRRATHGFIIAAGVSDHYRSSMIDFKRNMYIALILALTLLLLSIFYIFRQYLTTPIQHLTQVAKQLRAPKKGLEVRDVQQGKYRKHYPPEIQRLRKELVRSVWHSHKHHEQHNSLKQSNHALKIHSAELQGASKRYESIEKISKEADKVKKQIVEKIKHNSRSTASMITFGLASIKNAIELDDQQSLSKEQALHTFKLIGKEMANLQHFTSEQLHNYAFNPEEMLTQCITVMHKYAVKRDITLEWSIQHNLPNMRGDYTTLLQIVLGLMHRSLDFLSAGNHMLIHASRMEEDGDTFLVLSIKDDGLGWTDNERDYSNINENDIYLASELDGTDLRMPSVHKLINHYQADLECHDVWDQGSELILYVPYDRSAYLAKSTNIWENENITELPEDGVLPENVIKFKQQEEVKKE